MPLDGKQKRLLKSAAQLLPAGVTIGKAGMSEGLVAKVNALLEIHELIKVRLPEGDRKKTSDEIASLVGAELVSLVGRAAVLYRPNPNLPPGTRITLP